jgi:serine/threonine-protein kinase
LALDRLVRGCLAKDPEDRWQDARDLRRALDEIAGESEHTAASDRHVIRSWRWQRLAAVVAVLGAAFLAGALWPWPLPAGEADRPVTRVVVPLPATAPYRSVLALSPDGGSLVYALGRAGNFFLHPRPLDQFETTRVEGSGGGQSPFFSPDGEWIGFFAQRRLKTIRRAGGNATVLCELPVFDSGTWGADGTIVFAPGPASGLFRISDEGGTPQPLTTRQPGEQSHRSPQFLPDGKAVLFKVSSTELNLVQNFLEEVTRLVPH